MSFYENARSGWTYSELALDAQVTADRSPNSGRERGRIVHVAESLGGGLLEVLAPICRAQAEAGFAVTVIHGRRPETPADGLSELFGVGVQVRECTGWGERRLSKLMTTVRRLRKLTVDAAPDAVVFHSSFAGVIGGALHLKCPTVFVPHAFPTMFETDALKRALFRLGEVFACRTHAITVAVSESEAQIATKRGARQVKTILNGIAALDNLDPDSSLKQPDNPRVIAAGRLVPQRRPVEVASILSEISELAEVAWIGGGGDGQYADAARSALIARGVPVSGWVPSERVKAEMSNATVYLHWTSWDGLALTVLEAIAQDALVLASDIPPNREVLGAAQVFSNEQEVIAAIQTYVCDQGIWSEQIRSQRRIAARFGASEMCQSWTKTLEELILDRANRSLS